MNRILVIGAAGMIGRKLLQKLAQDGSLGGSQIAHATLHDLVAPQPPPKAAFQVRSAASDLSRAGEADKLVAERPSVIFHLAAVVSSEAEADFEKGYRVNLDGTRQLFEAIRKVGGGYRPRVVFTSSIAVFGAPFPEAIGDEFLSAPLTSYGTQKAMAELLLSDYTRRGFFDGIGIRLPRSACGPASPTAPPRAFSRDHSRAPQRAGSRAACFRGRASLACVAARGGRVPAPCGGAGGRAHRAAAQSHDARLSVTIAEQIAALRRVAGDAPARLIRREPDPAIMRIVKGWPRNFDAQRARELGFRADASFEEIIRIYMEEELPA